MDNKEQRTRELFVDENEKRVFKNIKKVQEGKDDEVTKARFLTLIREEVDKADSKFHHCLSTGKSESDCLYHRRIDIGQANDIIESTRRMGKSKSFYLPCLWEMLDDGTLAIIKETNEKVSERTSYGRRNEMAENNSFVLTWSNSSKAWYPTAKARKGETVNLDSNMILLKESKDKARLGHAAACLQPLPLYKLSSEAIKRKETPIVEGINAWAERQLAKEKEMTERKKHI